MFHKEYIRDRMLKEVAQAWSIEGHVNEDNFDPLVNMLVTALSSESELVYKEIGRTQDRVASSLMSKLIPYVNKGVQPGHAMVLLNPGESYVVLPCHTGLMTQIRSHDNELQDIQFVTSQRINLFKGGVVRMRSLGKLFNVVDYRFKVEGEIGLMTHSKIKDSQLIIDVEYVGNHFDLDSVPVFFDLRISGLKRKHFYDKLKRATFFIDGIPVSKVVSNYTESLIEEKDNPLVSVENAVCEFYKHQYFTLSIPEQLRNQNDFGLDGSEIKNVFSITVDFGAFIHPDILKELFCFVNAVPVINIRKHHKVFKGRNDFSVFHLFQQDPFYCMKSVCSDEGKVYRQYMGGTYGSNRECTYLLRKEEVEGLTEKGAREMIDYLTGVMRNENAVLSNVTKGNFTNDIKMLNQLITKLQHSLSAVKSDGDSTYVFLKDEQPPEYVFVDYYTTKGNSVRGLKVNNPLFAVEGATLNQHGNFILTQLVGGKNVLQEDEFIYEVRHAMLSGGRIVTSKDISSLLNKYYGDFIVDLKIEKGMSECVDLKRGFVRTIDIKLETNGNLSEGDCFLIGKVVLSELEEKGTQIYPYRLIVDQKEILK